MSRIHTVPQTSPVLLYDGECALCNGVLRFTLTRDSRKTLRFGTLTGSFARRIIAEHPELARVDSMVWLDQSAVKPRIFVKADAAIRLGEYLGGWYQFARLGRLLPRRVRNRLYDIVASNRRRWFGRSAECVRLTTDERTRWLDANEMQAS